MVRCCIMTCGNDMGAYYLTLLEESRLTFEWLFVCVHVHCILFCFDCNVVCTVCLYVFVTL